MYNKHIEIKSAAAPALPSGAPRNSANLGFSKSKIHAGRVVC
jgi:hypothetical protein